MGSEAEHRGEHDGSTDTGRQFEDLARRAGQRSGGSALTQTLVYVVSGRRWWLLPVVLALLVMGVLVVVGTSSAAPFIYALF